VLANELDGGIGTAVPGQLVERVRTGSELAVGAPEERGVRRGRWIGRLDVSERGVALGGVVRDPHADRAAHDQSQDRHHLAAAAQRTAALLQQTGVGGSDRALGAVPELLDHLVRHGVLLPGSERVRARRVPG